MKKIKLDPQKMTNKEDAHNYLANALHFPAYYGGNLDALHDVLGDIEEETTIILPSELQDNDHLGSYGVSLVQVIKDAAEENDNLTVEKSDT